MSETRDALEAEIGARAVGTTTLDGRNVPVAFPATEEQVMALLRLASSRGWRVLPIGAGTKLDHGPLRTKPRFALSVRGLTGITAFERGDGTLTARAGSTMGALADVARSAGMHVTPDVALAAHATLGGTLGAGRSGADRLRFGPVRHHVLGMRVALGDGTVTTTGGRLVKNVTGFDLHRLYTGSRGALCVILEASLRLFPAPESVVCLSGRYHGRDAALLDASELARAPYGAWSVSVSGPDADAWTLHATLAGRREPVADAVARACGRFGALTAVEGPAARALHVERRDAELATCVHAALMSRDVAAALTTCDAWATSHAHARPRIVVHPALATLDVALSEDADALDGGSQGSRARGGSALGEHVLEDGPVLALAEALRARGAGVELRRASLAARAAFDPVADASPARRALDARLEAALDPAGRFARTRPRAGSPVP